MSIVAEKYPKARKNYDCMACEWLANDDWWRNSGEFSFSELRAIAEAKANNWQIKKGDIYLRQTNNFSGFLETFIAIPAIHEICHKHDIYEY